MKLHKDKYAFLTLIHKIHDRSRIRETFWKKITMSLSCSKNFRKNKSSSPHISKAELLSTRL